MDARQRRMKYHAMERIYKFQHMMGRSKWLLWKESLGIPLSAFDALVDEGNAERKVATIDEMRAEAKWWQRPLLPALLRLAKWAGYPSDELNYYRLTDKGYQLQQMAESFAKSAVKGLFK